MKTNSKIYTYTFVALLIMTTPFCQLNGMKMPANYVAAVALECSICFNDTNEGIRLSCGHAFCKGCLKRIVDDAVKEKSTKNLVCPATQPRCARAFSLEEVRAITDNDGTTTNWHASILDREALIREHGGQPCPGRPGRNCSAILMRAAPQEAGITRCDECERAYCNACFLPADVHRGVNCARAQELYAQSNEATPEEKATLTLMRRNSKPCPRCNNAVEKVDGCNHMTCRCGHHFCWQCRANWIDYGHRCAQVSLAQSTGWDAPAPADVPHPVVPQPTFILVPRAAEIPPAQHADEDHDLARFLQLGIDDTIRQQQIVRDEVRVAQDLLPDQQNNRTYFDRQQEADRELAEEDGRRQQREIDLMHARRREAEERAEEERGARENEQHIRRQQRIAQGQAENDAQLQRIQEEIAFEQARRRRQDEEQLARQRQIDTDYQRALEELERARQRTTRARQLQQQGGRPAALAHPVVPQPALMPADGQQVAALPQGLQIEYHRPDAATILARQQQLAHLRAQQQPIPRELFEWEILENAFQVEQDIIPYANRRVLQAQHLDQQNQQLRDRPRPRPEGGDNNLAPIAAPVGAALWMNYAGRNAFAETTAALLTGYLMSQELDTQKKKADVAFKRSMYLPALFVSNACLHAIYPRRAVIGSDQFYTALASWAIGVPTGMCLPKIISYFYGKKPVRQVKPLQASTDSINPTPKAQ